MGSSLRTAHKAAIACLLACSLLAVTACAARVPTEPAGITGSITSVERSTDTNGSPVIRMLVEGNEQPAGAVSDKASVTVTSKTGVFGTGDEPATLDSLQQGMRVEVWFEGAVAESYPVQGTAKAVRLRP